jgi:hypothetical protein
MKQKVWYRSNLTGSSLYAVDASYMVVAHAVYDPMAMRNKTVVMLYWRYHSMRKRTVWIVAGVITLIVFSYLGVFIIEFYYLTTPPKYKVINRLFHQHYACFEEIVIAFQDLPYKSIGSWDDYAGYRSYDDLPVETHYFTDSNTIEAIKKIFTFSDYGDDNVFDIIRLRRFEKVFSYYSKESNYIEFCCSGFGCASGVVYSTDGKIPKLFDLYDDYGANQKEVIPLDKENWYYYYYRWG